MNMLMVCQARNVLILEALPAVREQILMLYMCQQCHKEIHKNEQLHWSCQEL